MQSNVSVVVVEGTLNSLGVVRSLSAAKMPIYVLGTSRNCAAGWSRFSTFVRVPTFSGLGLVDALTTLGTELGDRPVLILGGDQSVETVSSHRNRIEPLYRISLPSCEMVNALADKTLFQTLAERDGFPVPRAVTIASEDDLELLQSLIPPLIIKPADKTLAIKGLVERAVRANTLLQAQTSIARMLRSAPRVIVQEWVDGPDNEIFFTLFSCDNHGSLTGMFTGRKLVCSPPEVGSTAICVAAPEAADELSALATQFITKVGYRGLGSLEFKRDKRTGRFIIIEPTVGRTDWQEEIATLSGVNLPLMTYWAALGQLETVNCKPSGLVAWRSSIEHRVPAGALPPKTRIIDGLFRWSDPLPAVQ
jgi:D-aspartate ligase